MKRWKDYFQNLPGGTGQTSSCKQTRTNQQNKEDCEEIKLEELEDLGT